MGGLIRCTRARRGLLNMGRDIWPLAALCACLLVGGLVAFKGRSARPAMPSPPSEYDAERMLARQQLQAGMLHRNNEPTTPAPPAKYTVSSLGQGRRQMVCKRDGDAGSKELKAVVAGMARHADDVNDVVLRQLVELNCKHAMALEVFLARLDSADRFCEATELSCAPMRVVSEPTVLHDPTSPYATNRIARLTFARNVQRGEVRSRYGTKVDAVICADLDLARLAPVPEVVRTVETMKKDPSYPGAVVALGVDYNGVGEEYFDAASTVLESGTFLLPRLKRMLPHMNPSGHDIRVEQSMSLLGDFSQWDITRYLEAEAKQQGGLVRVRSGFSGLAVYRADVYLSEQCSYNVQPWSEGLRNKQHDNIYHYAQVDWGRPSEHIVFHECLRTKLGQQLVLDPALRTHWRGTPTGRPRHRLLNTHNVWQARFDNTFGTFKPHFGEFTEREPEAVLALQRGKFELSMAKNGQLVVKDTSTGKVHASVSEGDDVQPADNWYRLLVVLGPLGELMVIQQRESGLESEGCVSFDDAPLPRCREVLWQTDGIGPGSYMLELRFDGHVDLRRWNGVVYETYWSSGWDPNDESGPYHTVYRPVTQCYREGCPELQEAVARLQGR